MAHARTREILNRLSRIRGHVEGIAEMVQAERTCPDVITQIVAVRSALNRTAQVILEDHLEHCLIEAAETGSFEVEVENLKRALNLLL